MQWHTVLSIFPLDIAISCFLKMERLESSRDGERSKPPVNGSIDSIGCRVANNEAGKRAGACDAAEANPYASHIGKVRGNHGVIRFLSAVQFSFYSKATAHLNNFCSDWLQ